MVRTTKYHRHVKSAPPMPPDKVFHKRIAPAYPRKRAVNPRWGVVRANPMGQGASTPRAMIMVSAAACNVRRVYKTAHPVAFWYDRAGAARGALGSAICRIPGKFVYYGQSDPPCANVILGLSTWPSLSLGTHGRLYVSLNTTW